MPNKRFSQLHKSISQHMKVGFESESELVELLLKDGYTKEEIIEFLEPEEIVWVGPVDLK